MMNPVRACALQDLGEVVGPGLGPATTCCGLFLKRIQRFTGYSEPGSAVALGDAVEVFNGRMVDGLAAFDLALKRSGRSGPHRPDRTRGAARAPSLHFGGREHPVPDRRPVFLKTNLPAIGVCASVSVRADRLPSDIPDNSNKSSGLLPTAAGGTGRKRLSA